MSGFINGEDVIAGSFFEKLLAGRWIAGRRIEDAVHRTKELNGRGMGAILNYLGEEFTDRNDVEDAVNKCLKLINAVHSNGIRADVSVKPTQIGLRISYAYAASNYLRILRHARRYHVFVWLDMEGFESVDDTIRLYLDNLGVSKVKSTGICIQSYLKRSGGDVRRITGMGGVIRLVKGAYKESASIAYTDRAGVTAHYARLMKYLFEHSNTFTIATHDSAMIDRAIRLNEIHSRNVTLAMLNGIRNRYAEHLAASRRVYIYVPFGERWVDYSIRRLRELSNALLIARSLFSR